MGERRTGTKIHQFTTSTLKFSKSIVDVTQLVIVIIKELLSQASNTLIIDPSLEDLGNDSDKDLGCFSHFGCFLGHHFSCGGLA